MIDATFAVVAAGAVLLCAAGAAKLVTPGPALAAMRAVGLPATTVGVRAGAAVECAIGAWALLGASAVSRALVAASFAAFGCFLAVAMRSSNATDCGCFGSRGAPPRARQVALDLGIALVAIISLWASPSSVPAMLGRSPIEGACFVASTFACATLARLVHEPPTQAAMP